MNLENVDIGQLLLEWGPVWALVGYLLWDKRVSTKEHRAQLEQRDQTIREFIPAIERCTEVLRMIGRGSV